MGIFDLFKKSLSVEDLVNQQQMLDELEELKRETEQKNKEIAKLNIETQKKSEEINIILEQYQAFEKLQIQKQQEIQEENDSLRLENNRLLTYEQTASLLEKSLHEKTDRTIELQSQIVLLEDQNNKHQTNLLQAEKNQTLINTRLTNIEDENQNLINKLKTVDDLFKSKDSIISKKNALIDELKESNNLFKKKNAELALDYINSAKQIQELEQAFKQSQSNEVQLKNRLSNFEIQLIEKNVLIEQLEESITMLQQDSSDGIIDGGLPTAITREKDLEGGINRILSEIVLKENLEQESTTLEAFIEDKVEANTQIQQWLQEFEKKEIQYTEVATVEPEATEDISNELTVKDEEFIENPEINGMPKEINDSLKQVVEAVSQTMIDQQELVVRGYFDRSDDFEYAHLRDIVAILRKQMPSLPSRYRLNEYYEAGWHGGIEEIQSIHKQHADAEIIKQKVAQPYFARMDVWKEKEQSGQTIYIAKHNVNDYIISWKSPAAEIYYERAIGQLVKSSLGLSRLDYIRQIQIDNSKIVYLHEPEESSMQMNTALMQSLAEKRGNEMATIVATIQKEQYDLIRLPIQRSIIIQGSAGSGKSVIALHRLSYLLYKYKNLNESSVAIFGPNKAFLQYIRKVLPELGDNKVIQSTFPLFVTQVLGLNEKLFKNYKGKYKLKIRHLKGSLEYKKYVEEMVRSYLDDISPWLKSFSWDTAVGELTIPPLEIARKIGQFHNLSYLDRRNAYINVITKDATNRLKMAKELYNQELSFIRRIALIWKDELMDNQFTENIPETIFTKTIIQDILEWQKSTLMFKRVQKQFDRESAPYKSAAKLTKNHQETVQLHLISLLEKQHTLAEQRIQKLLDVEFDEIANILLQKQWDAQQPLSQQLEIEKNFIEKLNGLDEFQKPFTSIDKLLENDDIKLILEEIEQTVENNNHISYMTFKNTHIDRLQQSVKTLSLRQAEEQWINQLTNFIKKYYDLSLYISPRFNELTVLSFEEDEKKLLTFVSSFVNPLFEIETVDILERVLKTSDNSILKDSYNQSKSKKNLSWLCYEDLPALVIIDYLLKGKAFKQPLSYLIVDEAQDYMPFEIEVMKLLTRSNGLMLIGDLGQNLNEASTLTNWNQLYPILKDYTYHELSATYRSTKEIIEASNKIIQPFSEGKYNLSKTAYRNGPYVTWKNIEIEDIADELNKQIKALQANTAQYESIAIIAKTSIEVKRLLPMINLKESVDILTADKSTDSSIILTTPKDAKGLEFDCVIVVELNQYNNNDYDRKLAYVAMSRALHELHIIYSGSIKHFI